MKVITARKRSLGQGNIFTPLCSQGGRAWLLGGGMRGCSGGGMRGCSRGGVCGCSGGACRLLRGAWLLPGGVRGCSHGGYAWLLGGACMVAPEGGMRGCSGEGGVCGIRRHTEIRSMSGRYASYWNAFLLNNTMQIPSVLWNFVIEINCICTKKNGIYSLKLIRRKCYIFRQLVTCGRMPEYRIRLLSRWYHSGRRSKLPKLSRKRLHPARCLFRNRVWMLSRRRHSSSRTF